MKLNKPYDCVTFNLQRAARNLSRGLDEVFRSLDMTAQQFSTLAQLKNRGDLSMTDLSEHLGTERTTLTRNIDVLLAKDLIIRVMTDDQRLRVYTLSEAGRDIYKAALPGWKAWQKAIVNRIGKSEAAALVKLARKL